VLSLLFDENPTASVLDLLTVTNGAGTGADRVATEKLVIVEGRRLESSSKSNVEGSPW